MDERLAAYVTAQWTGLVDDAQSLCAAGDTVEDTEAQDLVLSTLTTVARRWWLVADHDHPDAYVRRKIELACDKRSRRRATHPVLQPMEIGYVDAAEAAVQGGDDGAAEKTMRYSAAEALAILDRRSRRARRVRLTAIGMAAVALLAVVAVNLTGSGNTPPRRATAHQVVPVPSVAFPQKLTDFATGVTAGGGLIWTIEGRAVARGQSIIVARDPVSGRIAASYRVPQQDDHIAFGLGKVWAWHDNTDFRTTAIATVDTRGGVDRSSSRPAIAVRDATFTRDTAWFTEPAVDAVVRFTDGGLVNPLRSRSAGARFVVPTSASSVLVAGRAGTLRQLPGNRVVDSGIAPPTLLSPAPAYGFWIGHGRHLSYQSSVHAPPTEALTLPLRVDAVVGDPAHGVYVATRSENPLHYDPYLVYYSPAALLAANPQPTARLDGRLQAEDMVANPAGGVVFVTNQGTVDAWDPTTAPRS